MQKMITTLQNWLVVGANPKITDPQNGGRAVGSSNAGVQVDDFAAMGLSAFSAAFG